jgi:hypothetical protein
MCCARGARSFRRPFRAPKERNSKIQNTKSQIILMKKLRHMLLYLWCRTIRFSSCPPCRFYSLLFPLHYTISKVQTYAAQRIYCKCGMYTVTVLLTLTLTACLLSASAAAFTTRMPIHNVNEHGRGRPSLVGRRASEQEAGDEIDVDSLGDWRVFRRNLAGLTTQESGSPGCTENEQVLRKQNEALANEYHSGVWAHETSTVSCSATRRRYFFGALATSYRIVHTVLTLSPTIGSPNWVDWCVACPWRWRFIAITSTI